MDASRAFGPAVLIYGLRGRSYLRRPFQACGNLRLVGRWTRFGALSSDDVISDKMLFSIDFTPVD